MDLDNSSCFIWTTRDSSTREYTLQYTLELIRENKNKFETSDHEK